MSMDVLKIWERIINQVKLIQAFQLGTRRHSRKHLCGQGNGSQALDREKKKKMLMVRWKQEAASGRAGKYMKAFLH